MRLLPILILSLSFVVMVRAETRSPNIVFMFIDDMGYADPSCFGNPHVQTPNIDRLAAEGIKLTNFYVNSPICSPSRVAVTTGQYPARLKIHSYLNTRAGNRSRGMRDYLDPSAPTTAKKLKAAGYATAHFGKWHMGGGRDVDDAPHPQAYGFEESLVAFEGLGDRLLGNPKNNSVKLGQGEISFCKRWEKTEKYTDRAIDFIQRHREQPFYVRLFPNDVHDAHVPWPETEKKWESVTKNKKEQKFFAVLEEMDRQLGRVIDTIDQLGLAEDTLIVFTSDNGPTDWPKYYEGKNGYPPGFTGPFFGRKWSLFEGGIRMPFVARWKGKIPAGRTDEESIMSGIDLSPTFCSVAKVKSETSLDGIDCSGLLLGKPMKRPEPLFWQYGSPHAVLKAGKLEFQSPSFAVRDGDWKLLVNPDGSEARLVHLKRDPGEQTNLLPTETKRAKELFDKLGQWATPMGFAFDSKATLTAPGPMCAVKVNGQWLRFDSHGVPESTKEELHFDGQSKLTLPSFKAPRVAKNWVRISASVTIESDGVIVAHGNSQWGYSLHIRNEALVFATATDGVLTSISSDALPRTPTKIEAFFGKDGAMQLKVVKKLVAKGQAPEGLREQPTESMELGVDAGELVLDDTPTITFRGKLSGLAIRHGH